MMGRWCYVCVLCLATAGGAGEVVIDAFEGPVGWTVNPDGGASPPVRARRDTEHAKQGNAALRLTYADAPPHWSNLQHPVTVPPSAVAIRLWLRVHKAEPQAAMHLWLFEPDNDGWLTRVPPRGKALAEMVGGWHEIVVPISAFRFQPRGPRTRQMTTASKMLIGCNFGDLDVTIDHLRFVTREEPVVSTPPRTKDIEFEDGKHGRVAILTGLRGSAGSAEPDKLAAMARKLGYGATLLKTGDAIDPAVLSTKNVDVLVIPCSPAYPSGGRDALLGFLKAGGSFVSIGGYAFDELVAPGSGGSAPPTVKAKDMDKAQPIAESINTRYGAHGDTMRLRPGQVGAFDPSYLLEHVAYAATAPGQHILRDEVRIDGPLEGFAACAMTGSNSPVFPEVYGRWIPILNAYDSLGRLRGAVASVVHLFDGPFKGSSWALLGVTNRDLIGGPRGEALLAAALRAVTEKTYLHGLRTEWACYRGREPMRVSVSVANHGKRPRKLRVRFGGDGLEAVERAVPIEPGKTASAEAVVHNGPFDRDFYRVAAELLDGDEVIDRTETAFVVWDDKRTQAGPRVDLRGNYLRWNGEPRFLCGTNQTGMMWYSAHEDPLTWERDFATMQAHGIRMLRILHFSPFAADEPTQWRKQPIAELLARRPKKLLRQTDAIVQLAQKHGVAVFLTLHDWMPVELSDADLAAQRDWNRFWADRYRHVPGILYDVQNEPSVQLAKHPAAGSKRWDDPKAVEANRALVATLSHWVEANAAGVKAGDPDALVAVGYLPSMRPADKVLGVAHTDFSNMHFYGPVDRFPAAFKLIDRRFVGKSFSLGEFGAREAHDARTHGRLGTMPDVSIRRFLATTHYALGLGGSFALNWDWKDFDDCVFPWGLCHPCDLTPKPVLLAYRNTALFFERLRPRYEDPGVYLLVPDSHRLGGRWNEVHAAIGRAIDALIGLHVNFNVANEDDLDKLPPTCRVLIWPVPYCPSDAAFERVRIFVRDGGTLYLSGDVAYDEQRRRTRATRLAELGLKDVAGPAPFAKGWREQPAEVQKTTVGKGKVFYIASPIELLGGAAAQRYRDFLAFAGVERIAVEPDHPRLHVFTLPLAGGGSAAIVCNRTGRSQDVKLSGAKLAVGADLTALVALTDKGEVVQVECTGRSASGRKAITSGDAHVMVASLDGRNIRQSLRLAVFPITKGTVALHTAATWHSPVLEAGELDGPSWRPLATRPLRVEGGALRLEVDDALLRSLLVVRERDAAAGLR